MSQEFPHGLHPMSLREATADEAAQWLAGHLGRQAHLHADSRRIASGDGFLARPGKSANLQGHIDQAIAAGAGAVVIDAQDAEGGIEEVNGRVPMLRVPRLGQRMGMIASAYYGRPSMSMQLVAVTGTNGKSTVTCALAHALARAGISAAAVGTLGVGVFPANCPQDFSPVWDDQLTGGLTTPDPVDLQRLLRSLKSRNISAVALEASSIGLAQGRLQGSAIKVAAFTNLSHDHLDLHGSMESYAQAKALLFQAPSLGAIVVNMDDPYANMMWQENDPHVDRIAIGKTRPDNAHAGLQAQNEHLTLSGWDIQLSGWRDAADLSGPVHLPVFGRYNIDNALTVAGCMLAMGIDPQAIRAQLSGFRLPPGRLQMVCRDQGPWACIDYAHSPDALSNVLEALRPLAQSRQGDLVCVFGCGGDRDAAKRPVMGKIAADLADRVVLTSDNPRSESPSLILDAIESGIAHALRSKVFREPDRGLAIMKSIVDSRANDIVLIAGKGHEQTQIIGEQEFLFSDAEQATRAIEAWAHGGRDAAPLGSGAAHA